MRSKNNKLVSVTMAAFNTAPFLVDSVGSILSQTYSNFELIIVDDGSTDNTRAILKDFAERDPRIRLILKDANEGLSVARNTGIAAAQGVYVTFLDSDDMFHPDMLRLAVEAIEDASADMAIWDYRVFYDNSELFETDEPTSPLASIDSGDKYALLERPAFAWTRLVRHDALERLDISFPRGLTYQDVPVHWKLITKLDRIVLVPIKLTYYRQQPEATTAGSSMKRADYFAVLDIVGEYLVAEGLVNAFGSTFIARQLNAFHGVYDVVAAEHKSTVMNMIHERLTSVHWDYVNSNQSLRWQARTFYQKLQGSHIATIRYKAWQHIRWLYRIAPTFMQKNRR